MNAQTSLEKRSDDRGYQSRVDHIMENYP